MAERKEVTYSLESDFAYEHQQMLKAGWESLGREIGPNYSFKYAYVRYTDGEKRVQRRRARRFWYAVIAIPVVFFGALGALPDSVAAPILLIVIVVVGCFVGWLRVTARCRNCGYIAPLSRSSFPTCERCGRSKRAVI